MKFELEDKPLDQLLLDPNNYRFMDLPGWKPRQIKRYHDQVVQEATLKLLEGNPRYNLTELRESMLANGYVRLERLVVIPYEHCENRFLVIEGNRRVAALRSLLRDSSEGVLTLTEDQVKDFSTVPVAILNADEEGLMSAQRILMGIRHIAGPQEWGAYQQAHLIRQLVDEEAQGFDDIAKHLGLSAVETHRRYRAIRALSAMQQDEMYSKAAKPTFYRLFHELVSLPTVRGFFSWDHEEARFTDVEKARSFFELIEPLEADRVPKLRTYSDVRQLRLVIGDPKGEASLLDLDETLATAVAKAQPSPAEQNSADLLAEAKRFCQALENAQIEALVGLTADEVEILEEVANLISSRLEQYHLLKNKG